MSLSLFQDPFGFDALPEMKRMQRQIDELLGALSESKGENKEIVGAWKPSCDIKETDKEYVLHAELPGVSKDDINIEVHEGVLTISGEKKKTKKESNEKFHRVERSYGKFVRSMTVPEELSADQIKARYENGVLEVTIPKPPKKEEPKPKRIKIALN
eukprot:CAMPEP_0168554936 /NCGR_PEP_ID=MMETSP0413-20121227/8055_1 /TAXON_ID=136452 /ORGANISM="Filamoeba nolandi, Strain NC-AS-23-1" /LENGTH=156 /DNA_ID=CAMNT_0008585729 /DNA_START=32 /DNA_END=498 /DNA_ORIENTATION=+